MEWDDTVDAGSGGDAGQLGPGGSPAEWIRRAREGDSRAAERLFERYLPVLRRWAAGRLPPWAREHVDTDDLIQDTLLKTLRNLESFAPRHEGALAAYLRQAVDNRIRDEVRKVLGRPRREGVRDDHPDESASPLEAAVGSEALRRYEAALCRLSDEERDLILARVEMGLTYDEVANATGRPSADAARMAVGRALVRLAREMDRG